jgi:predicted nucleotidyltransferase
MDRENILRLLRRFKSEKSNEYNIQKLGIFGSTARDSTTAGSDLDVVVVLKKQDLFSLIGIKQELEEELNIPVDIVSYRDKMNAFLKRRIESEAVYV